MKTLQEQRTESVLKMQERITELEKENAELKERIKTLEYRCENIKDTDTMELVALQKENAELKEALKGKVCNCMTYLNFKDLEKENAKAKELLKQWLSLCGFKVEKLSKDTEQFLSEVKK